MAEEQFLPLPDDWSVFKTRGNHSREEIECINLLFAGDPRLEELGTAVWIEIYRAQRRKRKKTPEGPTGQATRTKARSRRS